MRFDPPAIAAIVRAWGVLALTAFVASIPPRDLALVLEGTRRRVLDAGERDTPARVLLNASVCWESPLAQWALLSAAETIHASPVN